MKRRFSKNLAGLQAARFSRTAPVAAHRAALAALREEVEAHDAHVRALDDEVEKVETAASEKDAPKIEIPASLEKDLKEASEAVDRIEKELKEAGVSSDKLAEYRTALTSLCVLILSRSAMEQATDAVMASVKSTLDKVQTTYTGAMDLFKRAEERDAESVREAARAARVWDDIPLTDADMYDDVMQKIKLLKDGAWINRDGDIMVENAVTKKEPFTLNYTK